MQITFGGWSTPPRMSAVRRLLTASATPDDGLPRTYFAACNLIAENPSRAAEFTVRSNLVAVVTNGTAVLGLGNIGPLAAKPVRWSP